MIHEALRRRRAFNLIHYKSSFKIDVFPLGRDEYSQVSFARKKFEESRSLGPAIECSVASAEDTILRKLEWYRAGGETSEKQWNDVRGVVLIRDAQLDRDYLWYWAKFLKVDDLLERLFAEIRDNRQ